MKLKFLVTVLEISHGTLMINDQEDSLRSKNRRHFKPPPPLIWIEPPLIGIIYFMFSNQPLFSTYSFSLGSVGCKMQVGRSISISFLHL